MNIYRVPFDFNHEEKIFGGYLSLRQMTYLILTVASGSIFFIPTFITIKFLIFLLIATILLAFAFLKIGPFYSDKFLVSIIKYIFRKKVYIYEGEE